MMNTSLTISPAKKVTSLVVTTMLLMATFLLSVTAALTVAVKDAAAAPPQACTSAPIPDSTTGATTMLGDGVGTRPCTGYGRSDLTVTRGNGTVVHRWMGAYQSNSTNLAAFFGSAEFWVYGTCVQDTGTHPNTSSAGAQVPLTTYAGSIDAEVPYLSAVRAMLEPTVASGLPGSANWTIGTSTYTLNDWWAGMWAYSHYVAQDQSGSGTVIVPTLTSVNDATIDSVVNTLRNLGTQYPAPWTLSSALDLSAGSFEAWRVAANGAEIPGSLFNNNNTATAGLAFFYENQLTTGLTVNGVAASPATTIHLLYYPGLGSRITVPATFSGVGTASIDSHAFVAPADMQVYQAAGQFTTIFQFQIDDSSASDAASVYFAAQKVVADGAVAPTGIVLQARDANDAVISNITLTASGQATWGPIDSAVHPAPYSIYEISAPVNVVQPDPSAVVGVIPTGSADAASAVAAEITIQNDAVAETLRVRKALSDPSKLPAGRDLSGFVFQVTGPGITTPIVLTTGPDGTSTTTASVITGTYTITETAVPAWAQSFVTNPGPQQVVVDGNAGTPLVTFVFTNLVNTVRAATQLSTPVAKAGDVVTDYIWIQGVAPATVLDTNLAVYQGAVDVPAASMVCDAASQVATIDGTFTTAGPSTAEAVYTAGTFTIPAGTDAASFWVAGTVTDSQGTVLATLPCGDVSEMVIRPAISTRADAIVNQVTSTVSDSYDIQAFPAVTTGWTVVANFPLFEYNACPATGTAIGTVTETITVNGPGVTTTGVAVTEITTYMFNENMDVTVTRDTAPTGWTVTRPGTTTTTETVTLNVVGNNCDDESSPNPVLVTQVNAPILFGQPSVDTVTVAGFNSADVATKYPGSYENLRIVGGMYSHDSTAAPSTWTCDASNLVKAVNLTGVTGDGSYTMPEITAAEYASALGKAVSYQEQLAGTRVYSDGTRVDFITAPHGCQSPSQTQYIPTISTQVQTASVSAPGTNRDIVKVSGLPATLPTDWKVVVKGGLHVHSLATAVNARKCETGNKVADISFQVPGNGTFTSPGEKYSTPDRAYSYHEYLEITTGNTVVNTAAKGCTEVNESFIWGTPITKAGASPLMLVLIALVAAVAGLVLFGATRRRKTAQA